MASCSPDRSQKSLAWLEDIEIEDLLSGDTELIFRLCGKEVLVSLWESLPPISLYLSRKPLEEARKRYIRKHFDGSNVKALAVTLDVSERHVYKVIRADNAKKQRNGD
jgi:Mor family transcriptional regulator